VRRVAVVQLSDVVDRGSGLVAEARHQRTYPGCGTLDSLGFLRALCAAVTSPIAFSIEPISDALETHKVHTAEVESAEVPSINVGSDQ